MQHKSYTTEGGIEVSREIVARPYSSADTALAEALDHKRGVLFSSSFEFPGRYTRWDMGFVDPPLVFTARGRGFSETFHHSLCPSDALRHQRDSQAGCDRNAIDRAGIILQSWRLARFHGFAESKHPVARDERVANLDARAG